MYSVHSTQRLTFQLSTKFGFGFKIVWRVKVHVHSQNGSYSESNPNHLFKNTTLTKISEWNWLHK